MEKMRFLACDSLDEYRALNEAIFLEGVEKGFWGFWGAGHYADPNPEPDENGKHWLFISPRAESFDCLKGKSFVDDWLI